MTPIQFPSSPITPEADITEHCLQAMGQLARDFERALSETSSVNRTIQIRERVTACLTILAGVEREGFDQTDRLSEAKGK